LRSRSLKKLKERIRPLGFRHTKDAQLSLEQINYVLASIRVV